MLSDAPLDEYRRRRRFDATPEPAPGESAAPGGDPGFVVQRHDARALHFDLRLEVDGALASWAVPKGVPLRTGVKRLAVRTEDHPLEYLDFAARIPAGQYGAGLMTIWDRGTYEPLARKDDEWKVALHGGRLDGEYHLVRTGGDGGRDWLIFRSSRSGEGVPDPVPRFLELRPMLARLGDAAFDDPGWAFELKWDGYRSLALITGDGTRLASRTGRDLTAAYPALAGLRRAVIAQEAVLDGEIVILDGEGRPDFGALQRGDGTPVYVVFDLLYADGAWTLELPWSERRALLEGVISPEAGPSLMRADHVEGRGTALFAAAKERDLEGIVAKRRSAPYRPGVRSDDWRKIKIRQETVLEIGGYTLGSGSRRHSLGAIIVGERTDAGLVHRGQVGSGFGDASARALRERLDALRVDESPFAGDAPVDGEARWVRPELRAEVAYAELTTEGRMRAPVFVRLHEEAPPQPPRILGADGAEERILRGGDREVRLTNLNKPFWAPEGITKGDLLEHYARVAGVLVPHLAGRPMILKRYPDGADAEPFFQHNIPQGAPDWIPRVDLARSDKPDSEPNTYVIVDDALTLMWVVNLGCIDLNPWQSRAATPGEPTHVLFDLDPADGLPFDRVVETCLAVREELDAVGLRGHPKTTGGTGMHVFVPVTPSFTHEVVRLFAAAVADRLVKRRPDLVTTRPLKADRGMRVYLDANQNGRGRSISSVYSVRPRRGAPVATPLAWEEVQEGIDPRDFTMAVVADRVARLGDLFAPVLTDLQDLAPAAERLAG